jgi:hypothetical protein
MAEPPPRVGEDHRRALGRRLLPLLAAVVCGVGLLWAGLPEAFSPVGQWDFETYYYALKVRDAGGNPWDMAEVVKAAGGTAHYFIFPPHTLAFFRLFAFDDVQTAKDAYLVARLLCVAGLLTLWAACFVRAGARGWFLAFAALGFNATICRDLVVGNVSILEQVPIWLGLWALLRGRPGCFCALIIVAAQFKLLPAVLLLLLLVTKSPRKWEYLFASVLACGLVAAGVYWWDPQGARIFLNLSLHVGTMEPGGVIHPSAFALIQEVAERLVQAWAVCGHLPPKTLGNWAYLFYAAAVLVVYGCAAWRGMDVRRAVFTGILTYVLLAPRMKDYSYIIALVPTFELIRESLTSRTSERLLALTVGAVVLLTLPGLEPLWQYRPLLLAAWAWVIGVGMQEGHDCRLAAESRAPSVAGRSRIGGG